MTSLSLIPIVYIELVRSLLGRGERSRWLCGVCILVAWQPPLGKPLVSLPCRERETRPCNWIRAGWRRETEGIRRVEMGRTDSEILLLLPLPRRTYDYYVAPNLIIYKIRNRFQYLAPFQMGSVFSSSKDNSYFSTKQKLCQ